ncbi:hypothetical protein PI125_g23289 [Phytophthora idaei]|nr:hypothetical protein PI125_g23289 [Phytophthora idaei]
MFSGKRWFFRNDFGLWGGTSATGSSLNTPGALDRCVAQLGLLLAHNDPVA